MYRPQFPYPTPAKFADADFDHYFDYLTVPLLNNTTLASGGQVQNIPLTLQSDWPFYIRGIQIKGANAADPVVAVQFKDPFGNYLSEGHVPLDLAFSPDGTGLYFTNIVFEPELLCPAGGVFWLNIRNQTGGNADLTKVRVTLSGIKRRMAKGVKCAA